MAEVPPTPIRLLDPRAEMGFTRTPMVPSMTSVNGKSVALLDNIKPNGNVILEQVGEILMERYGVEKVDLISKRGSATPAEDAVLEQIAAEYHAAVTGLGD